MVGEKGRDTNYSIKIESRLMNIDADFTEMKEIISKNLCENKLKNLLEIYQYLEIKNNL